MAKEDEENKLDEYNLNLGTRITPNPQETINQANAALDEQFAGRMIPSSADYEVGTVRGFPKITTGLVPGSTGLTEEQQAQYNQLSPENKARFDRGFNYLRNMQTPTNAQSSPDNPKTIYDTRNPNKPIDVTEQYTAPLSYYKAAYEANPILAMSRTPANLSDEQGTFLEQATMLKGNLGALLRGEETGDLEFVNPNARYEEAEQQPNVAGTAGNALANYSLNVARALTKTPAGRLMQAASFYHRNRGTDEEREQAVARVQEHLDNIGYTGDLKNDAISLAAFGLRKTENMFGESEENNNQINMQGGDPETDTADASAVTGTGTGTGTGVNMDTDTSAGADAGASTVDDRNEVVATGSVKNPFASGDLNYQYEVTKSDLRILQNSGIFNNRGLTDKQLFDFVGDIKSSGVSVLDYVSFSNQMRNDPSRKREFDSLTTGAEQGAYIRYQNALEDMQSRNLGQRFGVRTDKKGNVSLTKEGQKRVFLQQLGRDIFVEGKFSMSEVDPNKMFEDTGDGKINFSLEEYSALINKRASMLERLQTNYEAQNNELGARRAQQEQENLIVGTKLQAHYATLSGTRIAKDGTQFNPIEMVQEILILQEQLEETRGEDSRKRIEKNIKRIRDVFGIADLDIRAVKYIEEYDKRIAKTSGRQ